MGTPDFAIPCLKRLVENHEVAAVVTQPDKPRGRGKKMLPPPVKEYALKQGIDVLQPDTLKDGSFLDKLQEYKPEVIVVAAYGKILPKYVLDYPQYGCINLHASLLPKYRGAAPIQWAIINGEKESGVCTMKMEEGLDTGGIYESKRTDIAIGETAGELHDRLSEIGADLIISTLEKLPDIMPTPQDDSKATYAPMITKEMAKIRWDEDNQRIVSLIHGLNPAPKAYAIYNGEQIKILRASVGNGKGKPGQIIGAVKDKGLEVGCKNGSIFITQLQRSGGRIMNVEDYLRGHKLEGFFEV
jgi:methionyl-tRNA formyltransferase